MASKRLLRRLRFSLEKAFLRNLWVLTRIIICVITIATYWLKRWNGESWDYVTSDNDPETTFTWKRRLAAQSRVTLAWNVPADAQAGTYRLVYRGDAKDGGGKITPITGTSSSFEVK